MKIKVECKEVVYRSVEINTEDYDISDDVFKMAEFINMIKDDAKLYISENLPIGDKCIGDSDIEDLKIFESK